MRALIAAWLRRTAQRLEPEVVIRSDVRFILDADTIVKSIQARNRRRGGGTAGV